MALAAPSCGSYAAMLYSYANKAKIQKKLSLRWDVAEIGCIAKSGFGRICEPNHEINIVAGEVEILSERKFERSTRSVK
jgi:hypothetical protein